MENTDYLLNLIYLGVSFLLIFSIIPKKQKGWAKNVMIASCACLLLGVAIFLALGFVHLDGEAASWTSLIEKVMKGLGLAGLFLLAVTRNLRPKENDNEGEKQG